MNAAVSILTGIGGLYLAWSLFAIEVYILNRIEQRRAARAGAGGGKRRASAGPS